jgi:4-aminobutyrate aminotransferase
MIATPTTTKRTHDYPRIVVAPPGPRAKAIIDQDATWTASCYIKEYPLVIQRAQGSMVEDVDGNRYLDFMAGIAVAATGHSHPEVVAAIKGAAERFLHICGGDFYYEGMSKLAERLARLAPGAEKKRVFFTNSGTEAVEGAIKLARNATRRPGLIAFTGSFHGRTYGSMSLTASKSLQRAGFGPLLPEVYHVPYGDVAAIENDLFVRRLDPRDTAAIIVEPIQGEGGYVVPQAGFLRALRDLCDRHGILLVMDEVQSGIGRTGRMFACEFEGVEPDVLLCAKGLASGMPLGAIIAKESVMKWERGQHGSTFGGNPVCCAAALATLDLVEREYMANAAAMGERLKTGARRLAETHSTIIDVRGRGLMLGVEFAKDKASREPVPELVRELVQRSFQRGLLLLGAGKSTLRLAPPLLIDEYDVDTALGVIDEVLTGLRV